MTFKDFCIILNHLETISSRNEMNNILVELFKKSSLEEIKYIMYMLQGRVAPKFMPLEFNFSTKTIEKIIRTLINNEELIDSLIIELGDLGNVIEKTWNNEGDNLELKDVFEKLVLLTSISGKNSQLIKRNLVIELAKNLSDIELKYVIKIIIGKLRLGVNDKTILDSLSIYLVGDKNVKEELEKAYGVSTDMGIIAQTVLKEGIQGIRNMAIQIGTPILSKLVEREADTQKILERMGNFIVQPKYDGLRMQLHYSKSNINNLPQISKQNNLFVDEDINTHVKLYSRNLEDLTNMFPDIVDELSKMSIDQIILDAEVIAIDNNTGRYLSFQETIKRKRKNDINQMKDDLPIKVICFDILLLNNQSLLNLELSKRLEILTDLLAKFNSKVIVSSEYHTINNIDNFNIVFDDYVAQGLEGIIAKGPNTFYAPGTRNYDWIKLKAASQSHLADSIDAVVLGYYYGEGNRAKHGIGALLVGLYDNNDDIYYSVAKLGTGIKDEQWIDIKAILDKYKIMNYSNNIKVDKALIPDVMVELSMVVEIEADEITRSKIHGTGYSLRFPRLKHIRYDKNIDQITTISELKNLFEIRNAKKNKI
jgi:DNA ligase 1